MRFYTQVPVSVLGPVPHPDCLQLKAESGLYLLSKFRKNKTTTPEILETRSQTTKTKTVDKKTRELPLASVSFFICLESAQRHSEVGRETITMPREGVAFSP